MRTKSDDSRFLDMCKVLNSSQEQALPTWTELGKSSTDNLDKFKDVVLGLIGEKVVASAGIKYLDGMPTMGRVIVDPNFRGQGIGEKLCLEIENIAKEKGHKKTRLIVGEYLKPARVMYEKLGYVEISREQTHGENFDITMEKVLV